MQTIEIKDKDTILNEDLPQLHSTTSAIVVKDKESRALAVQHIDTLKEVRVKIEEVFHPTANKVAAYRNYELALDTEKKFYSQIDADIKQLGANVKQHDTAEALRIKREAEARQAEADRIERERQAAIQAKIDEENRKIQAAKDEELRIQREKQAEIDRANKKERDRLQAIENERRAKEAAELAEKERKAALKTEKLEEKKEAAPIPVFTPPVQTKKLVVKAKVLNVYKLCKLIADGIIPFNVVEVSQANLNSWAKGQDPKTKLDGIEFTEETTRI